MKRKYLSVLLQKVPDNPDKESFPDIILDELQIQGIAIGVYHRLEKEVWCILYLFRLRPTVYGSAEERIKLEIDERSPPETDKGPGRDRPGNLHRAIENEGERNAFQVYLFTKKFNFQINFQSSNPLRCKEAREKNKID